MKLRTFSAEGFLKAPCKLPQLDRRQCDFALRYHCRHPGSKRSACNKCRPDRDIWNDEATPSGVLSMPAFGGIYSDAEIAAVANYVTQRFGNERATISDKDVAALRNQTSH